MFEDRVAPDKNTSLSVFPHLLFKAYTERRYKMIKTCAFCGKEFVARTLKSKYCSVSCQNESRKKRIKKTCLYCGKEFEVTNYTRNKKYCCKECLKSAKWGKKITKKCEICGKEFITTDKLIAKGRGKYCGTECKAIAKRTNLAGKKFGKWTVLKYSHLKNNHHGYWLCRCECGTEKEVTADSLIKGTSKSCGCWRGEPFKKEPPKTHLPYYQKLSLVLAQMKARCYNPDDKSYKNYGGRGIKIYKEWHSPINFYNWAMGNGYEEGLTIERIDVNGNYCPGNCTWVPKSEQAKNRRCNVRITINDETHCLSEWCRIYNIADSTVWKRTKKMHWDVVKALIVPVKGKN